MSSLAGLTRGVHRFLEEEEGSAYTLSYVMVLPFMIILIVMIAETAMILTAKIGTTYAAFAAARTAIVWQPAGGDAVAHQKSQQAAVQALAPFANGLIQPETQNGTAAAGEEEWLKLYQEWKSKGTSGRQPSDDYLRRKFRYASSMVSVGIAREPPLHADRPWDYDLRVTVEYKYTFHVPVLARMFGSSDGKLRISSTSRLQNEAPMNEQESLGISYASP